MDAEFILRPHRESDLNLIRNSWASSYYTGADYDKSPKYYLNFAKSFLEQGKKQIAERYFALADEAATVYVSSEKFNEQHRPIRENILNRPTAAAIIACNKKEEDQILGWMLVEKTKSPGMTLHYIYVKGPFKEWGVSDQLLKALPDKPVMVTHMTDRARKIIMNKKKDFKDFVYAPNTVMLRDKYLNTLPRSEEWFLKNLNE